MGSIRDWLHSTACYVYCSHFLSAWGDRMWQFAVGLFLIRLSPHSLQLTAIYGLSVGGATLLFGAIIGDWIDKNPRLKVARLSLIAQNSLVILCAITICLLVRFEEEINGQWEGWLLTLVHGIIILFAVLSQLASMATSISVQRDWIAKICDGDGDMLAVMTSVMRRIDLATNIIAPIATGQVLTYSSLMMGAIVLAGWNVFSFFIEYFLLWKVYVSVPSLAFKGGQGPNKEVEVDTDEPLDEKETSKLASKSASESVESITKGDNQPIEEGLNNDEHNETNGTANIPQTNGSAKTEESKEDSSEIDPEENTATLLAKSDSQEIKTLSTSVEIPDPSSTKKQKHCCDDGEKSGCMIMFSGFIILYRGWRTYMKYQVSYAGIGLALLYMTVLGFDNITTGFAYSQGISESVLGMMMAAGAVTGIIGTFAYPRMRRRIGLERTGLYSFFAEIICLCACVASVWAPGSPFDVMARSRTLNTTDVVNCTQINITAVLNSTTTSRIQTGGDYMVSGNGTGTGDYYITEHDLNHDYKTACGPTSNVPISYVSIGLLMAGIIAARFGLWISDLTITQLQLESVVEMERGVVNGVQNSLNKLMDLLKFAMVVAAPEPEVFGILIFISFAFICLGFVSYGIFAYRARGHLFHFDKIAKCGDQRNNNIDNDMYESEKQEPTVIYKNKPESDEPAVEYNSNAAS